MYPALFCLLCGHDAIVGNRGDEIVLIQTWTAEGNPVTSNPPSGTVLSYAIDLEGNFRVPIVGDIPAGMPIPAMPTIRYWSELAKDAFVIALGMANCFHC